MKRQIILFTLITMTAIHSINAQENNIFSYQLGEYTIHLLSEGQHQGNTGILIGATPEMIAEYIPEGIFPNATNAFLIQTPEKNILVDTGYGKILSDNLQLLGFNSGDIDIILITHMHGDHIGGLLKEGQVVFPRAQLYISQPEYDYWINTTNEMAKNVLKAYKNQLILFEPNELDDTTNSIFPGIKPIAAYGHTPGHTAFLIESEENKLLIWGDLAHAMAIQMPFPQVAVTYDVNPEKAIQSRLLLLKYVSENTIPIAGMHIAYPAIGNILSLPDEGYKFNPY